MYLRQFWAFIAAAVPLDVAAFFGWGKTCHPCSLGYATVLPCLAAASCGTKVNQQVLLTNDFIITLHGRTAEQLHMKSPVQLTGSFNRPNIGAPWLLPPLLICPSPLKQQTTLGALRTAALPGHPCGFATGVKPQARPCTACRVAPTLAALCL
jgi:hypothetical protein